MRTRLSAVAGIACLSLAACGGSDNKNTAPTPANATQVAALQSSLAAVQTFSAAPQTGPWFVDPSSAVSDLLGDANLMPGVAMAPSRALSAPRGQTSALAGSGFDNPACATVAGTTVTFAGCKLTADLSSGGNTLHMVSTLDGTVSIPATHTLSWDMTMVAQMTVSGANTAAMTNSFHYTGTLTVTASTFVGHFSNQLGVSGTVNGVAVSAGVDETLDANVTFADAATCATRVTGGTLEARRVWTTRPAGYSASQLPDAAAKVTWTGCGQATVQ